jgi:hypothetical protein
MRRSVYLTNGEARSRSDLKAGRTLQAWLGILRILTVNGFREDSRD